MFIGVVLFFPDGFVGIWQQLESRSPRGRRAVRIGLTATPLLVMSLFVLAEVLGLTPQWMRIGTFRWSADTLQLKYIMLVAILAGVAVWSSIRNRRARAHHSVSSLEVAATAAATASPLPARQEA